MSEIYSFDLSLSDRPALYYVRKADSRVAHCAPERVFVCRDALERIFGPLPDWIRIRISATEFPGAFRLDLGRTDEPSPCVKFGHVTEQLTHTQWAFLDGALNPGGEFWIRVKPCYDQ